MKAENITLIDLCYRYGASPAAQTLVTSPLLSTQGIKHDWIESGEPHEDLIKLMRYQRGDMFNILQEPRPSEFWLWHARLNFYSLLMVAQFTHAVPSSLPESFIATARRELGACPPGRYAESGFPLAGAFVLKLDGLYEETAHTRTSEVFHRLLALDASVRTDPSMSKVYWLASVHNLEAILSPPETFRDAKSSHWYDLRGGIFESARDDAMRVIYESSWSFLRFCTDLYELLSCIEGRTLAGLIRLYYAHVLDAFNDYPSFALREVEKKINLLGIDEEIEKEKSVDDIVFPKQFSKKISLRNALREVTNRELWPLPSNLEFLLTDKRTQLSQ